MENKDIAYNNDLMTSEFIFCVDNAYAENELEEHGVYQVHKVIVAASSHTNLLHVCFELKGKPGKKYHCGRFKIFAFSPN